MPVKVYSRLPQIAASLPRVVDAGLGHGAGLVEDDAKARVHVRSGELRDSIHTEKVRGGWSVVAGDSDTFHGHLEEFGTTHSSPHPFLVPALEENRDRIVATVAFGLRGL